VEQKRCQKEKEEENDDEYGNGARECRYPR